MKFLFNNVALRYHLRVYNDTHFNYNSDRGNLAVVTWLTNEVKHKTL